MISVILAQARDGAIGHGGDLLWHLRADLRHFRDLTMGHPVIMGRKTWESLPKGALPGRRNIVITGRADYSAPGAEVVSSPSEALALVEGQDAFVIGGARIYEQLLPLASRLYLTRVEADYPHADTRMAPAQAGWRLHEAGPRQEAEGLTFRFEEWRR